MKRGGTLKRYTPMKRTGFRRNKFGAISSHDMKTGRTYDSLGERRRWDILELLERAGEIQDLVFKPKVVLIKGPPEIAWHVDYSYTERGRTIMEDWKPRPATPRENLLFKLWQLFGPGPLRITGPKGTIKEIMPIQRDAQEAQKG